MTRDGHGLRNKAGRRGKAWADTGARGRGGEEGAWHRGSWTQDRCGAHGAGARPQGPRSTGPHETSIPGAGEERGALGIHLERSRRTLYPEECAPPSSPRRSCLKTKQPFKRRSKPLPTS